MRQDTCDVIHLLEVYLHCGQSEKTHYLVLYKTILILFLCAKNTLKFEYLLMHIHGIY